MDFKKQTMQQLIHNDSNHAIHYNLYTDNELTFRGGTDLPIHSWIRLTPSYSPILVRNLLKELNCNSKSKILDPFSGIGTTVLECQIEGFDSIGIEINPFLYDVILRKTRWNINVQNMPAVVKKYINDLKKIKQINKNIELNDYPNKLGIQLPTLYNYKRWWRDDVLKDLLMAKSLLQNNNYSEPEKEFLKTGLMSMLMDVASVTYEGVQFTFLIRTEPTIDVFGILNTRLLKMINDIEIIQEKIKEKSNDSGKINIMNGDSVQIHQLLKDELVTHVITSPPYPNRYSYVWNTRPYLFFFDYFNNAKQSSNLDGKCIGGTWGVTTSILEKGIIKPYNQIVDDILSNTTAKIREHDSNNSNLMANYVMKYFNMMAQHIESLTRNLADDAKLAYVIGNSEIKDVEVPADILLADIFQANGLTVDKIVRVRPRRSGKKLYEAIVYASK
ncbi:MAG: DNA methyltransferase [Methanoregula sp.]